MIFYVKVVNILVAPTRQLKGMGNFSFLKLFITSVGVLAQKNVETPS